MPDTIIPRVGIDAELRKLPGAEAAIEAAVAYLGSRRRTVELPADIRWRFAPLDRHSVELEMSDETVNGPLSASLRFPLKDLDDPVNRDIWVLRAWRGLLRERSKRNMEQFRKMLRDFEESLQDDDPALTELAE